MDVPFIRTVGGRASVHFAVDMCYSHGNWT
jgi:hypothetical protein